MDGAPVALIADTSDLTYWPLTGGPGTTIAIPSGAQLTSTGESVLFTLPGDQLGYLHGGALQTVEVLPRTDPGTALDGAIIVTQPDTGAWWTLRADAAPTSIRPAAPAGAGGIDRILTVTPDHVLIAWKPAKDTAAGTAPTDIVTAYDRGTGTLLTQTTAKTSDLAATAAVHSSQATGLTAAGPVTLAVPPAATTPTLTVTPGLQPTAVHDRIYGTLHGQPVTIGAAGHPRTLPAGTLIPVGRDTEHLMVTSQARLYALNRGPAGSGK